MLPCFVCYLVLVTTGLEMNDISDVVGLVSHIPQDEFCFANLTRNGPFPRFYAPLNRVNFDFRMASLRDDLREADRNYEVDLIKALHQYRQMAEKVKNLYCVTGYRLFVRKIQDSLYDCWDQLGLHLEMAKEEKLLNDFEVPIRMRSFA